MAGILCPRVFELVGTHDPRPERLLRKSVSGEWKAGVSGEGVRFGERNFPKSGILDFRHLRHSPARIFW